MALRWGSEQSREALGSGSPKCSVRKGVHGEWRESSAVLRAQLRLEHKHVLGDLCVMFYLD